MIFPNCERLGQTIIFVRTRESAKVRWCAGDSCKDKAVYARQNVTLIIIAFEGHHQSEICVIPSSRRMSPADTSLIRFRVHISATVSCLSSPSPVTLTNYPDAPRSRLVPHIYLYSTFLAITPSHSLISVTTFSGVHATSLYLAVLTSHSYVSPPAQPQPHNRAFHDVS